MTAGPVGEKTTAERSLLDALPIPARIGLLTGADSWHIPGSSVLGLRPMATSDGPAGVRGVTLDDRNPSSCLPCPSAVGATWNPGLVTELAAALGAEARGKGVDILLGPTINLMRTPLGGRGFECFSEDPELTARIAVGYVRGVQQAGVAATAKHFVGNDSETDRWTYDAIIAAPVLRELYLVPFEACVREADVALVMAAYNAVNGSRMTEHGQLLREVLKEEWGFSGLITSDWDAARSTVPAAVGGLDLAMPGPNPFWGDALAQAVADGQVPLELLDDKVIRLLRVARRVGALAGPGPASPDGQPDGQRGNQPDGQRGGQPDGHQPARLVDPRLLRRVTAASLVLLRNEAGFLPLDRAALTRVAVIGPNGRYPVIQGGGSAGVLPVAVSTPVEALRAALAGHAAVTAVAGCRTWQTVPPPEAGTLSDPDSGEPGVRLEFLAGDGTPLGSEHRSGTTLAWWGSDIPDGVGWDQDGTIVLRSRYRAGEGGPYLIGVAAVGQLSIAADGAVLAQGTTPVPADPVETMTRPGELRAPVTFEAGQVTELEVRFRPAAGCQGPLALRVGVAEAPDEDEAMAAAVDAAAAADAVVLVAGSAPTTESEGFDRDTLVLPGRQDELIRRVAAVNPRTVVVVNAGMPVLMPWASQVPAVVYAWLPGQAMGEALADVLLGRAEPGGRLPVTMPAAEADCPVLHAQPRDGRLVYEEGLLMGYRGYDVAGTTPMFPFGHGLGYTRWDYESIEVAAGTLAPGTDLDLRVTVRNTGSRPGREVVQVYVGTPDPGAGRPVRVLGAFGGAVAAPGEAVQVALRVPARIFAVFDEQADGWVWPPAEHLVQAGRSSRDLRLAATVRSG